MTSVRKLPSRDQWSRPLVHRWGDAGYYGVSLLAPGRHRMHLQAGVPVSLADVAALPELKVGDSEWTGGKTPPCGGTP